MTKLRLAAAAAAALALALPPLAAAQATPEQVATQYLQSVKAANWSANAALVHPAEQDSLKAALLDVATADTSTAGLRSVFHVASAAELRALSPQQVFERFVAGTVGNQPGMHDFLSTAVFNVMGHVSAGDTAYVVYRVTATPGGTTVSQVSVLSLRRDGAGWKVRLPEEMKEMIGGLRTAAAQRRAANAALTPPSERGQQPPAHPAAPPATPPAAPSPAPAPPTRP